MKKNTKILLWGISNITTNYGVEGIVRGTIQIIEEKIPSVKFFFQTEGSVTKTINRYRDLNNLTIESTLINQGKGFFGFLHRAFSFFVRRYLKKYLPLKNLNKYDYILIIGGDLYTEGGKDKYWPYPWILLDRTAELLNSKAKVFIWGASMGPFENSSEQTLKALKQHFQICSGIFIREQGSFDYISNKFKLKNNHLVSDPAFVMSVDNNGGKHENVIGLNISPGPIEYVYGDEIKNTIKIFKNFIKSLTLDGYKILFIPHVGRDFDFMSDAFKDELKMKNVKILENNIGALNTKKEISNLFALFATRFHCSIAGFSSNTPTTLLMSSPKGKKLLKSAFGGLDNGIDLKKISEKILNERLNYIKKERTQIVSELTVNNLRIKKESQKAGQILINL
tara:strand:+ start:215 stop:1399 length:1185 start_codon:yes stop_codon:yes gene_type:complete